MAVLVVDDSADTCRVLRDLLLSGGHHDVITAASAEEAFSHLGIGSSSNRSNRVELVLMDLGMPGMSGVDACRVIKADEASQDIPVLMVTGQPESHHVQAAFAAGAQDFIRKPVERSVLLARVHVAQQYKREIDRRKERERELLRTKQLLEQANAALNRLAALDGLTGVANRRRFDEYLDIEWRRAMRTGRPISLILADIDRFKSFNDIHGHQAGDECLRSVTSALGRAMHRSGDLLARYGGEEFAVVLPATEEGGASFLAESMRAATEALHIPHPGSHPVPEVTISLGTATLTPERQSLPAALVLLADSALYQAKRAGRNCVRTAMASNTVEPDTAVPDTAAQDTAAPETAAPETPDETSDPRSLRKLRAGPRASEISSNQPAPEP